MKTKEHWDIAKTTQSYYTANKLSLQLKEFAKEHKISPRGIKVLSKEECYQMSFFSDAAVIWKNGPVDWPTKLEMKKIIGVSFSISGKNDAVLVYDDGYVPSEAEDD